MDALEEGGWAKVGVQIRSHTDAAHMLLITRQMYMELPYA